MHLQTNNYQDHFNSSFIDISVNEANRSFSLAPCSALSANPLETLLKIETVLRKKFVYTSPREDCFATLEPDQLSETLHALATHLHQNAIEHSKETVEVLKRVDYLVHPPKLLPLPPPMIMHTLSFLGPRDLSRVACVCRESRALGTAAKAREYGMRLDESLSNYYITKLLETVALYMTHRVIPQNYIVYRNNLPNAEATLEAMNQMSATEIYQLFSHPSALQLAAHHSCFTGFLASYFIHRIERGQVTGIGAVKISSDHLPWLNTGESSVIQLLMLLKISPCERSGDFSMLEWAILNQKHDFVQLMLPFAGDLTHAIFYSIICEASDIFESILSEVRKLPKDQLVGLLSSALGLCAGAHLPLIEKINQIIKGENS